jgi:hypothetical protein
VIQVKKSKFVNLLPLKYNSIVCVIPNVHHGYPTSLFHIHIEEHDIKAQFCIQVHVSYHHEHQLSFRYVLHHAGFGTNGTLGVEDHPELHQLFTKY